MTEQQTLLDRAIALVDAANSEDPNKVTLDGKDWPKELLYSCLLYTSDAADDL